MKDYLDEICARFPVRNSNPQKESFRGYVLDEAGKLGYASSVETQGVQESAGAHCNIVIGDPEKARAVFTAHYDTPRRSLFPNLLLPLNPVLKWIYTFIPVLALLAVAIGAASAVRGLAGPDGFAGRLLTVGVYIAVYFGLFLLLFRGPANRNNRNDNTSGTAAVLALSAKLAGTSAAAFILFDNEEKGKKGSKAFADYCPKIRDDQLVVNMDCVGNGSRFIVSAPEAAMRDPRFPALSSALESIGAIVYSSRKAVINSDQKNFSKGIGICACRHSERFGYYTPYIHTSKDTVASPENIKQLTDALASFIRNL